MAATAPAPAPTSAPPPHLLTGPTLAAATLLVKHLPEAIPLEMLSRLFSPYGAVAVRPCAGGRLRNCAFVDFRDETTANHAQTQFNRLKLFGKTLVVVKANQLSSKDGHTQEKVLTKTGTMQTDSSVNRGVLSGEPIAPRLGVEYPFPPHLEYAYPPPDGNILTNIVNALIAVPRFYTQVLHLMNKMNIPAPFRMALPTPPITFQVSVSVPPPPPEAPVPAPPPPPDISKPDTNDLSSDESEMESSDDDIDTHERKRAKREPIVGPAVDKTVTHEAVGLKPALLVPKELPVLKKRPVLQINVGPKPVQKKLESDESNKTETDVEKEPSLRKPFANPQEIEKGKLPPEEILSLPMFKNYTPGNPSTVLYIKNLAKDVVQDDFYFIFGSLFEGFEKAKSDLSIKLFEEGRMRGQAFVTFPSANLAQQALKLVNGYLFKGKPMIIQFGRNPAANKAA